MAAIHDLVPIQSNQPWSLPLLSHFPVSFGVFPRLLSQFLGESTRSGQPLLSDRPYERHSSPPTRVNASNRDHNPNALHPKIFITNSRRPKPDVDPSPFFPYAYIPWFSCPTLHTVRPGRAAHDPTADPRVQSPDYEPTFSPPIQGKSIPASPCPSFPHSSSRPRPSFVASCELGLQRGAAGFRFENDTRARVRHKESTDRCTHSNGKCSSSSVPSGSMEG